MFLVLSLRNYRKAAPLVNLNWSLISHPIYFSIGGPHLCRKPSRLLSFFIKKLRKFQPHFSMFSFDSFFLAFRPFSFRLRSHPGAPTFFISNKYIFYNNNNNNIFICIHTHYMVWILSDSIIRKQIQRHLLIISDRVFFRDCKHLILYIVFSFSFSFNFYVQ